MRYDDDLSNGEVLTAIKEELESIKGISLESYLRRDSPIRLNRKGRKYFHKVANNEELLREYLIKIEAHFSNPLRGLSEVGESYYNMISISLDF